MSGLVERLRAEGNLRVAEKELIFGDWKTRDARIADDLCHRAANEIERLQRELAEAKKLAYAPTDKGPVAWEDLWQREVDEKEWLRSSLNPSWEQVRLAVRRTAFTEAAEIAEAMYPQLIIGELPCPNGDTIAEALRAKAEESSSPSSDPSASTWLHTGHKPGILERAEARRRATVTVVSSEMIIAACDEFIKHYGTTMLGLSMQEALRAALRVAEQETQP